MFEVGQANERSWAVGPSHLASAFGSGNVDVLATPVLVGFCEECARSIIDPLLPAGQRSVGTAISLTHLAATPPGLMVTVRAEITSINGRRISFSIEARDPLEVVARGTHDRFVIDLARFDRRVQEKRAAAQDPASA